MTSTQPRPSTDVHQHLLPPELLDALRRRRAAPRLRGWTLGLAGEPDYEVRGADHDVEQRVQQAGADGLQLALVSLSSALGIEQLAHEESVPLLDAYHDGALALPAPFSAWAATGLARVDPAELDRRLADGFVGLQLPATTLLDARGYAHVAPLLELLEVRRRPLFVHPGPLAPEPGEDWAPAWWPAIVDYVTQMHAAWYAFRLLGRPRYPRLRVCFALLAGLAPLHAERFAARAGERSVVDERAFLEVSSYGTRAIDAVLRILGVDVLVHGSDRPYAEPPVPQLGDAVQHALRTTNPARLLHTEEVSDDRALTACA